MAAAVVLAQGGGDNFLVPNGTFFAELLIFAVIVFVIWRYVVPPVKKAMVARQDMVRRQIEDSREARERLEAAEARYREVMSEARTEAAKIRDEARAEAAKIRAELREQADREVAQIRQRGEEQLATQRDQTVRALRAEIGQLAVALASRIVGESMVDEARRRGTVDRFIAELEGMPARQTAASAPAEEDTAAGRPAGTARGQT
jgi:F-type H+-transporting ATPase subunit b